MSVFMVSCVCARALVDGVRGVAVRAAQGAGERGGERKRVRERLRVCARDQWGCYGRATRMGKGRYVLGSKPFVHTHCLTSRVTCQTCVCACRYELVNFICDAIEHLERESYIQQVSSNVQEGGAEEEGGEGLPEGDE